MGLKDHGIVRDLAFGALAGAAATWALGLTTTYLYEREDPIAREAEDAARGGRPSFGVAAEKVSRLLGLEPTRRVRHRLGNAIHWGLGIGAGAAYAVLRRRVPGLEAALGTVFGTAFWLLVDEGANVALGLTPGPTHFPWQAHARGLAGHLVYGAVAETVLDVADRVA